jgi:hypothetical protein
MTSHEGNSAGKLSHYEKERCRVFPCAAFQSERSIERSIEEESKSIEMKP